MQKGPNTAPQWSHFWPFSSKLTWRSILNVNKYMSCYAVRSPSLLSIPTMNLNLSITLFLLSCLTIWQRSANSSTFRPIQGEISNICWALLQLATTTRPQPGLSRFATTLAVGGIWLSSVCGHSWVEELRLVSTNATFKGPPEYPCGNGQFLTDLSGLKKLDIMLSLL